MRCMSRYRFAVLCAALISCGKRAEPVVHRDDAAARSAPPADAHLIAADAAPAVDWYRASVGSGSSEVPFFLGAPPLGTRGGCTIINGDERIAVECAWTGPQLLLSFPMFATTVHATRDDQGRLAGTWELSRLSGATKPAPFAATPIASPDPRLRFPAGDAPSADASGTWKLSFAALGAGKGTLVQTADGVVTGTLIPQAIGDMRYLAGNLRGTTLLLSTFDGQHAYVVHATIDPAHASMTGAWTFSQVITDKLTAKRVPAVDPALMETLRLKKGATGVTIPQLDDPAYRGKPVIVDYFGTWCPACMDETPFLVELYRKHHAAGLEILSIALESTTDDAYNARQVEYFRAHYGVPWKIVILPGEYEDSEKLLPPELTGTGGYPVTIFLDRDRHVRALHSGFFGPAAGDDYTRLKAMFEATVTAMLAAP